MTTMFGQDKRKWLVFFYISPHEQFDAFNNAKVILLLNENVILQTKSTEGLY